jgi:hypothetical protein
VQRTRTADDRGPDGFGPPLLVTYPPRHIPRALLLAVLAVLAVGVGSATAASTKAKPKPPCWKTLINDWYDGRIDGTYPIHCYREALKHLPTDVETYSSARDDIKQALQKRITQSHNGGGQSTTGGTSGGSAGPGGGSNGKTGGGSNGKTGGGSPSKGGGSNGKSGPFSKAIKGIGPSHADSVPVPLIVLGGVALLLMAAGGAGFLARRMRTRKLQLASAASLPSTSPEQRRRRR